MTAFLTRARRRRLANAAAIALLVIVTSITTSWAAARINGSRLVSRSVTGAKLKLNTVSGAEVNEASLSRVPSATSANHADTATNATNAFGGSGSFHRYVSANVAGGSQGTVALLPGHWTFLVACDGGATSTSVALINTAGSAVLLTTAVGATTSQTLVGPGANYIFPGAASGVSGVAAYRFEVGPSYSVQGFITNNPLNAGTCNATADVITH